MDGLYVATQLAGIGAVLYTTGRDVSSGWFALRCPYCQDDGEHLVVNDESGGWHCWRCSRKGGPEALLRRFGIEVDFVPSDGIREVDCLTYVKEQFTYQAKTEPDSDFGFELLQKFRDEFHCLIQGSDLSCVIPPVVFEYARKRNISKELMESLELAYVSQGAMAFRLIFPIFYQGRLANYVGRDVTGYAEARYKYCRRDQANLPLSSLLWNYDQLSNRELDVLYICEGIFDSLSFGIETSTCCFKAFLSPLQVLLLRKMKAREFRIVFDRGAIGQAIESAKRLSLLQTNVSVWVLDEEFDDPGEATNPENYITQLAQF